VINMANEIMKLILTLSISGGLFALLLFALKPFMRNRLSKSFQYYIWIVVLLRFILPFSFGINLMDFMFTAPDATQAAEETVIPTGNPLYPTNSNPTAASSFNPAITEQPPYTQATMDSVKPFDFVKILTDNLLWIWLAGVLLSLAFNLISYWRFIRYIHSAAVIAEIPDCSAAVYKSRFTPVPMLVGVIRPRIYLPDIVYEECQLDHILRHEFTHLQRRDVWLKWFVMLVVSLHWFNPIVYLIRREISRACELSCDEAIIHSLDSAAKQSYGDTLISMAAENRHPVSVMSTTMCEEKKKLKERLVAIMNYKKKTKITYVITAVLAVVITASAFAFGASVGANSRNLKPENEGVTIISQDENGILFHIDKIMPNEAICLDKIDLNNGVKYTLTLTSESGTPFAALNESPDITSYHGIPWDQFEMNASLNPFTTTFSYINKETYYIYVGSMNKTITNVDIVLTFEYTNDASAGK